MISFLKSSVLYFSAIENIEEAKIRCEIMTDLAPDAIDTEVAMKHFLAASMKAGQKRYEEERKSKIFVETKTQETTTSSQPPKFYHQEINWLYSNGLYIEEEKINTILSLPKSTLISDLELVLHDSINRYGYFSKLVEENEWEEEKMNFVIHAVYLLGELEATEALDSIFTVLSQSYEYFEIYFGDFITSMIWEPVYKIAAHNLEECKQFVFRPGIDTYARTTFPDMVEQLVLHHPERRDEALKWFAEIIQFLHNSNTEDNVIDSDFIGLLICNIIDIKGSELLPEIQKLFEKKIVSEGICGDWEEVSIAFERPKKYDNKKEILPILDRYKQITSTWAGYQPEENHSSFAYDNYIAPTQIPVRAEPKIGRNEKCPCGSGKKYKKCCMNK